MEKLRIAFKIFIFKSKFLDSKKKRKKNLSTFIRRTQKSQNHISTKKIHKQIFPIPNYPV